MSEKAIEQQRKEDRAWTMRVIIVMSLAVLLAVLLWIAFGAFTFRVSTDEFFRPENVEGFTERAGQIGDTFGATNALFSAVAVAFIAVSTMLQTHELRAQRRTVEATQAQLGAQLEELELAREETRLTREEHAKSADALAKQVELSTLSTAVSSTAALASVYVDLSEDQNVRNLYVELESQKGDEARRKWLNSNDHKLMAAKRAIVHINELGDLQARLVSAINVPAE